ncbi:MAG: acetoacetate--CoA ligase, partial [Actinomycetota bacterium]|nr:acetoacetate--CoA ligase [Actinomycetota bacterium]
MADGGASRGEVLWEPAADALTATRLGRFATTHGHSTYAALHDWSVHDLDGFWRAVATDLGVRWRTAPDGGVALADGSMPGAHWFPAAALNYA